MIIYPIPETWNAYCERHRKYRHEFTATNADTARAILSSIQLPSSLGPVGGGGGGRGGNISLLPSQMPDKHPAAVELPKQIPVMGKMVNLADLSHPPPGSTAPEPPAVSLWRIVGMAVKYLSICGFSAANHDHTDHRHRDDAATADGASWSTDAGDGESTTHVTTSYRRSRR